MLENVVRFDFRGHYDLPEMHIALVQPQEDFVCFLDCQQSAVVVQRQLLRYYCAEDLALLDDGPARRQVSELEASRQLITVC